MKRTLAAVAALGLMATACASTGTTSTAAGDSTQPPSTELGQGVTSDTIKVGVVFNDLSKLKDLIDVDHGDLPSAFQDVATYINDHGGINGRTIELVDGPIDALDPTSGAAVCTHLTEDEHVFAVVGEVQSTSAPCFITDHATPAVGGIITEAELQAAKAPWFSWRPSAARLAQQTVEGYLADGTFEGKKVAVITTVSSQGAMNDEVVPSLEGKGVDVVDEAVLTPTDDTASLVNEAQVFAERFRSDGADVVVVLDNAFVPFAQGLAKSDYRPKVVSTSTQDVLGYLVRKDFSIMPGLVSGGAPRDTGVWNDPAMQECVDHVRSIEPDRDIPDPATVDPGHGTWYSVTTACQAMTTFQLIAEKAGDTLNNDTFRTAGQNLGTVTIPGVGGPSDFTPDDPSGSPPVFLAAYDPQTETMVVESTPVS